MMPAAKLATLMCALPMVSEIRDRMKDVLQAA
jgi:hypothetical protein